MSDNLVERFSFSVEHEIAYEDVNGDWVKFAAYEAQRNEVERLKAESEAQAKRIAELEQKEIVLDRLIAMFEGKHKFVGTKMVHKELPRVSQIGLNEASVCAERVNVYQWVFRADGETSFKLAVMNLLTASKNGDSK